MIPVNRPYERIRDLSRKDKSGYTDPDEYNRNLRDAQQILMSYYLSLLGKTQHVPESLQPFITRSFEPEDVLEGQYFFRPYDLRYTLEVYVQMTQALGCDTDLSWLVCEPIGADKVGSSELSPIRRATNAAPRYYYEGDSIYLLPENTWSKARIRYVRNPQDAVYAWTEDEANDELVFDPSQSVDLEWLDQDETNLIDILMWMKGLETRDTAIIQWLNAKDNAGYGRVR